TYWRRSSVAFLVKAGDGRQITEYRALCRIWRFPVEPPRASILLFHPPLLALRNVTCGILEQNFNGLAKCLHRGNRCQRDEGYEQDVLHQILAALVSPEPLQLVHRSIDRLSPDTLSPFGEPTAKPATMAAKIDTRVSHDGCFTLTADAPRHRRWEFR